MIVKPYVPRTETDPRRAAGVNAERQMAHYLDRHFADRKTLLVLHDLRLTFEGDAAQIDHAVVHPFGVAIVESKSVTTAVRINAQDEWERSRNGRWQGMPNPLLQGERQGILLRRLLTSRTEALLDKIVLGMFQSTFRTMALDVFAAISDGGSIQRATQDQAKQALKADAVPNAIGQLVAKHRRDGHLLNPNLKAFGEAPRSFNEAETLRIAHFLRTRSAEARAAPDGTDAPTPSGQDRNARTSGRRALLAAAAGESGTAPADRRGSRVRLACRHCGSLRLEPKIGRYGPYGQCRDCAKNTSVRLPCRECGSKIRVERSGSGFAGRCDACGTTTVVVVGSDPS